MTEPDPTQRYQVRQHPRQHPRQNQDPRWHAETEVEVQFFDLDPMQIVWHGNYIKYLEIVRCVLLNQIGYNYEAMKLSGYAWPVIDVQIRYVAPATFNQRLKLCADIVEWQNRLKINYLISDALTGKHLTRASTTQVAVEQPAGKMCLVSPAILFDKLGVKP